MICPACEVDLSKAIRILGSHVIADHFQSHRKHLIFQLLKASSRVANSDGVEGIVELKRVLEDCKHFEIQIADCIKPRRSHM